jgi:hypothetical protein
MFLALPLLLAVLSLSYLNTKKDYVPISNALLDVSFFVILVAFVLPFISEEHMLLPSSLLAVFMGGIYLLFYPLLVKEEVTYALPIVFSLIYYNLLYTMGVSLSLMGIMYSPLGAVFVTIALIRYRGTSLFLCHVFYKRGFAFHLALRLQPPHTGQYLYPYHLDSNLPGISPACKKNKHRRRGISSCLNLF